MANGNAQPVLAGVLWRAVSARPGAAREGIVGGDGKRPVREGPPARTRGWRAKPAVWVGSVHTHVYVLPHDHGQTQRVSVRVEGGVEV